MAYFERRSLGTSWNFSDASFNSDNNQWVQDVYKQVQALVQQTGIYDQQEAIASGREFLSPEGRNYVDAYLKAIDNIVGDDQPGVIANGHIKKIAGYVSDAINYIETLSERMPGTTDVGGTGIGMKGNVSAQTWLKPLAVRRAFGQIMDDIAVEQKLRPHVLGFVSVVQSELGAGN
jgi:hypothetical protein